MTCYIAINKVNIHFHYRRYGSNEVTKIEKVTTLLPPVFPKRDTPSDFMFSRNGILYFFQQGTSDYMSLRSIQQFPP